MLLLLWCVTAISLIFYAITVFQKHRLPLFARTQAAIGSVGLFTLAVGLTVMADLTHQLPIALVIGVIVAARLAGIAYQSWSRPKGEVASDRSVESNSKDDVL